MAAKPRYNVPEKAGGYENRFRLFCFGHKIIYRPNGGKSRKEGFAGEVCTKRAMAEVENFRLGTKGMRFTVLLE